MPTIQNLKKKLKVIHTTRKYTQAMKTASTIKFSKLYTLYSDYEKYEAQCSNMYKSYRTEFNSIFSVNNPDAPELYIIISGNKGMCGSFNNELISFFESICNKQEKELVFLCCGRKIKEFLENKNIPCINSYVLSDIPLYSQAQQLFEDIKRLLDEGAISGVKVVYPKYRNMVSQVPVCEDLFSFGDEQSAEQGEALFIPDKQTVIKNTAEEILISILYKKILETALGAQAATFTTMRSAYDTACEYSTRLETQINRKRQSQVTADVIEISSEISAEGGV